MKKPVDKICANCRHFGFKPRSIPEDDFGSWVYCGYWNTYFPNARGWAPKVAAVINARRQAEGKGPMQFKKPGERVCTHFEL